MPHRHLNALTAELLASIEETRRRIAESEDQLQRLMAEAREKLAQSYRLLHWAGKILSGTKTPKLPASVLKFALLEPTQRA